MKKENMIKIQEFFKKAISVVLLKTIMFFLYLSHPDIISAQLATAKPDKWPYRVLLTNDDGIYEEKLWALGKAFSEVSETYMVASFEDKSGTSNIISIGKYKRTLFVKKEYQRKHLTAYGVAGYPADCVLFAVKAF